MICHHCFHANIKRNSNIVSGLVSSKFVNNVDVYFRSPRTCRICSPRVVPKMSPGGAKYKMAELETTVLRKSGGPNILFPGIAIPNKQVNNSKPPTIAYDYRYDLKDTYGLVIVFLMSRKS